MSIDIGYRLHTEVREDSDLKRANRITADLAFRFAEVTGIEYVDLTTCNPSISERAN